MLKTSGAGPDPKGRCEYPGDRPFVPSGNRTPASGRLLHSVVCQNISIGLYRIKDFVRMHRVARKYNGRGNLISGYLSP